MILEMRLRLNKTILFITGGMIFLSSSLSGQSKQPPSVKESAKETMIYTGGAEPDKYYFDGRLPHAVGVHHHQAMRANRENAPEIGSEKGWTYNHQPYLAYWNGQFYLQYLSGEIQEHTPPTRTLMMTSKDGRIWSKPEIIFPVYDLPAIKTENADLPAGTKSVMHQRMGFYVAPNGKLLTMAFYSYCATPRHSPNAGQGLGRVVREVREDGSYGPIYFIRYNRHAGFNEDNTNYPYYKESKDKEFIEACEAILNDKLVSLQWWEEDRGKDGFFVIDPGDMKGADYFSEIITTSKGAGKAFNYYTRPDGVIVGIWKNQWSALSEDNGLTWTPFTKNTTINPTGAKVWGQKLDDGTYGLVHDQTAGFRNRYPMVIMTSQDGHTYENMYSVRGDIPLRRYQGLHKRIGAQYFRGIIEGNGNPPGDEMWVTYSVNKEDIWVTSINVPVLGEVSEDVDQDFESINEIHELKYWNLYLPQWAPTSLLTDAITGNKYLELRDEDPYDYAKIERVFPKSTKVEISFSINTLSNPQGRAIEIEVQDQRSGRPIRLRIDQHWLMFDRHDVKADPVAYETGKWNDIKMVIDIEKGSYDAWQNRKLVREGIKLGDDVENVERLVFRTGPYRGLTDALFAEVGAPSAGGLTIEDLPASGQKVTPGAYWIDNIKIKRIK